MKQKYQHLIIGGLLSVLVILWNCRNIDMCHQPIIFQDEAGYWTHAAVFAGQDWSGVSSGLVWYSYGYSFLLSVLMRLFSDPTAQYQAALVLNAVMLGAVFWIFWLILRKLFPKQNVYFLFAPALAGVCYAPYQVYSLTTWCEILILLLFSLITLLLFLILETSGCIKNILLGLLCAYCYMVHNRCIGLTAAVCLTLLLAMLMKKIPLRHVLCFVFSLGLGMAAHVLIKHHLTEILWQGAPPAANDAGTVTQRLKNAFSSWDGFRLWLSVFLAQGFSGMISGFCLPFIAFTAILQKLIRKRRICITEKDLPRLYLLLAFLMMLGISSIFMSQYNRIDHVIYTRYIDCTLGLSTAAGICVLIENKNRQFLPMLLTTLPLMLYLGANRTDVLVEHLTADIFNKLCAPFSTGYYETFGKNFFTYAFLAGLPGLISIGISQMFRKYSRTVTCVISCLLIILSIRHADAGILQIQRTQAAQDNYTIQLESLTGMETDTIYIKSDTNALPCLAQMRLQETHIISADDISEIPENSYFLCDADDCITYSQYPLMNCTESLLLFQNSAPQKEGLLPLELMSAFSESAYDPDHDTIISIEENPVLCYGPYAVLKPGSYEFELTITILSAPENLDMLGIAEIRSGSEIYAHADLTFEELEDNQVLLSVQIDDILENTELLILLNDPSAIKLELHEIKVSTAA